MTQSHYYELSNLATLSEECDSDFKEDVFEETDLSAALYFLIIDKEVYQGGDLDELITLLLVGLEM